MSSHYQNVREYPAYDDEENTLEAGQTVENKQKTLLATAKNVVDTEAYHMIRALDKSLLDEALKHSAKMLNQLRTSELSPKHYYDLYMLVFDKMRHLEMFFSEENKRGRRMQDLYEVVQHAGNIVPRLYLLITVGSVYIKSKEAPAKDVLKDLVEMCKGVQHPTRGLFLRNYLSQLSKDKLPDVGSEYEGVGGQVQDSINFIIQNFTETVHLFSRLKNEGPASEREKREKERNELSILVGKSLERLSNLEGVTLEIYRSMVLNKVLEVVVQSNDKMVQQYLMDCIIQVFPDEFHMATLDTFLQSCLDLDQGVDLRAILTSLMDRLSNFIQRRASQGEQHDDYGTNVVETFTKYVDKVLEVYAVELSDNLLINISLLSLSLQAYPERTDYVNRIITGVATHLVDTLINDDQVIKLTKKVLTIPLESYKSILKLLDLDNYNQVLTLLPFEEKRMVARQIVRTAIKHGDKITTVDQVNELFELIKPMLKDEPTNETLAEDDWEDFEEEQNLVARCVHLFDNAETDNLFKIYSAARKHFGQGGVKRIQFTLVPLVFKYLELATRIYQSQITAAATPTLEGEAPAVGGVIKQDKVFQYVMEILEVLANQRPGPALQLYLQSALCADRCDLEKIVYELLSQAFMLYEEEDSKVQLEYLHLIINALQGMKHISEENYNTLSTKTCQYSSKLLRKPDQCRAVLMCSHLFWPMFENKELQNSSKALECLQWSLKIVKSCLSNQQILLFVEILNVYAHHFDKKNDKVTAEYLNGMIDLIFTNIPNLEETEETAAAPINIFYRNTLRHLRLRKDQDGEMYDDVRFTLM
ncbi:vacuolar protein sorting protein VPS35 [Acrasis kona]|uniref:Vacuolar protein sorting-associated protein 35 n=1 Tax=Acrasis kona TaxID=1008807 RepID=A0AAW2ZJT8_9EUKA